MSGSKKLCLLMQQMYQALKIEKDSMKWNSLIGAALNKRSPKKLVRDNKIAEPQKVYPLKEHVYAEDEHEQDFQCITSRQMVGMFLTVWVRSDLCPHIRHLSVCSVGCGIMGCLGNKVHPQFLHIIFYSLDTRFKLKMISYILSFSWKHRVHYQLDFACMRQASALCVVIQLLGEQKSIEDTETLMQLILCPT